MSAQSYITKEKKRIVTFLFLLSLLQLLPFFILKENVTIPVNDTMDAYVPQYQLTAVKDFAFCGFNKPVPQIMNGLNRDLLVSDMSVIYILFLVFNAFWAFTLNLLLIKMIAFLGMYLFLKNNFSVLTKTQIAVGAFVFSCIPFFPFFGIGIAGQPLLVNALINFHKKRSTWRDVLILVLFPFYSSLIFTNIFIVFSCFLVCAYLTLQNKKLPFRLIFATGVLFLLGILVDYRLFHASMDHSFVPHRVEFDFGAFVTQTGIMGFIKAVFKILTTGIFHVETFYSVFVAALLMLYLLTFKKLNLKNILTAIVFYIVAIGLLYGLTHSSYYGAITNKIKFLKAFQIDRFYTLLPFLYFSLAAICIQQLMERADNLKTTVVKVTVVAAMVVVFFNSFPLKAMVNKSADPVVPTYAEYYQTDVLKQVQQTIALPMSAYKIVGVGIDPQVLLYNGFYTLDAYLNIYPLAYKKQFRPVIAGELAKSEELRLYFDAWGNRCYVFSAAIGKDLNKPLSNAAEIALNINTAALKKLSPTDIYVLSTKTITNYEALGLSLVKEFSSTDKFRSKLILYKVA